MSYTSSVSYNNSTFSKADKKARSAYDPSAKGDAGSAIFAAVNRPCVASLRPKEIHRAPSEAQRTASDKAITKVDDSKLVVRKDDDLGFTIKPAAAAPAAAAAKAPKKGKKVVDPSFFAASATSV